MKEIGECLQTIHRVNPDISHCAGIYVIAAQQAAIPVDAEQTLC